MNPYEQIKEALKAIMATATDCYLSDAEALETIVKTARQALSLPPRNCDVGTAEEQAERAKSYCNRYYKDGYCHNCPLHKGNINVCNVSVSCVYKWMQLPYEEVKND